MKQIFTHLFVALGVIFLVIIISGIIFIITDPYNIKPLIFGSPTTGNFSNSEINSTNDSASGEFQLSETQKQALISFGIDPSVVPSSINAEQENCFVSVLGGARVGEIKNGAVPNAVEFLKAKACI